MSRLLIPVVALSLMPAISSAQARRPIEAQPGDIILVRDTTRVRIVRRAEGNVRTVYNAAQRWLVVLIDEAKAGGPPDGRVDYSFNFHAIEGDWPMGERWEGYATLDEYSLVGEIGTPGIGLTTPAGLVQILSGPQAPGGRRTFLEDATAAAIVRFSGSGRSSGMTGTFDQSEQRAIETAARNAAAFAGREPITTQMTARSSGAVIMPSVGTAAIGPVRVGGNIVTPTRMHDVRPVTPETALQAGIRGVVILEIVVAPDGTVSDAKVLRSIPLLDQAAIDAARQWRYTPTLLNGAPVPVIMTVTVNFP